MGSHPEPGAGDGPAVTVSPVAAASVSRIVKEQRVTGAWYLRLRVLPGGCCGFMHKLDLDTGRPSAEDQLCESGGIKVVFLKRQAEMLRGTRVDYGQEGERVGFRVKNPNFEGESLKKWLPLLEAAEPAK
jgi:iron-sulfur cluster assembly accessory protein